MTQTKKKNKVFILVDSSGSMDTMWDETINSVNNYVAAIEDKSTEILLATFSNDYRVKSNTTVGEWVNLNPLLFRPLGSTSLLDSSARIMQSMMDSQAFRAILVLITDGYENSSKKYTSKEVKEMAAKVTAKDGYDYEIVFLGANFDNVGDIAKNNFGLSDSSRFMPIAAGRSGAALNMTATASASYFSSGKAESFYNEVDKASVAINPDKK